MSKVVCTRDLAFARLFVEACEEVRAAPREPGLL